MTATPQRAVRRLKHDMDDRPMIVIWEVTRACQLVCKHCRADSQPVAHPEQLTTEQGKALLEDIASFGKPLPIVILTGGDAFERPDLHEIISYGASLGLHMALSPSVTPKLTRAAVREMHTAGANSMSLSLDAAKAETHDAFRGISGVFDATIEAAHWMREDKVRLQVNTTVTRDTVTQLPDVLRIMLDVDASLWSLFFLVPTGRGQRLQTLDPPEIEDVLHWMADVSDMIAIKTTEAPQYRRVLTQRARWREEGRDARDLPNRGDTYAMLTRETERMLAERAEEGHARPQRPPRPPIDINSGRGFAFVDHRGNVYPSGFFPQDCGNVKDVGFTRIYRESDLLRALRRPDEYHGKCGVCEFNQICGGSRSHAYAVTGDILGSDPTCGYIPDAMRGPHERPGHAVVTPA
ncbi:TIGR04053 family radical SAM/SPASM domain-containing protein [Mobilicoccus pelagius]|uniref:PqqE homolog n=1 Tax=Mobilicoccus pelagius NBRC 104925 TaxID=1089455 RepID=H5UU56_9MICO|nr:TIGR04053 family radical SAM/SPASM domain-containing protein [Mobilicoccus pelagius]GAB49264.1 PqqE homolog [Mobilicoccus pelagius NBRC 104925]